MPEPEPTKADRAAGRAIWEAHVPRWVETATGAHYPHVAQVTSVDIAQVIAAAHAEERAADAKFREAAGDLVCAVLNGGYSQEDAVRAAERVEALTLPAPTQAPPPVVGTAVDGIWRPNRKGES